MKTHSTFVILLILCVYRADALTPKTFGDVEDKISEIKTSAIINQNETNHISKAVIIGSTNVIISDNLPLPRVAMALNDNGREIIISAVFIRALRHYCRRLANDIVALKRFSNKPSVARRLHRDTQLTKFAEAFPLVDKYSATDTYDYGDAVYERLLDVSLSDILLHEFGHHTEDAFHSFRATQLAISNAEKEAERWSSNYKATFAIDEYEIGRIVTLAAVLEFVTRDTENSQHILHWLSYNLDISCNSAQSLLSSYLCDSVKHKMERSLVDSNKYYVSHRTRVQ